MARSGPFNEEQIKQMQKEYSETGSLKKVAVTFGVSVPTVAKYLRTAGVSINKRGRPKNLKNVPVDMPAPVEVNTPQREADPRRILSF